VGALVLDPTWVEDGELWCLGCSIGFCGSEVVICSFVAHLEGRLCWACSAIVLVAPHIFSSHSLCLLSFHLCTKFPTPSVARHKTLHRKLHLLLFSAQAGKVKAHVILLFASYSSMFASKRCSGDASSSHSR